MITDFFGGKAKGVVYFDAVGKKRSASTLEKEDAKLEKTPAKRSLPGADVNVERILAQVHPSWADVIRTEVSKPYFSALDAFVTKERASSQIFPPQADTFAALRETALDNVKVVILGQDPYHNDGQAHGLSFSVPKGLAFPPSLRNILKEMASDIGATPPAKGNGDLTSWAKQGVLLLNTVLTVRAHDAHSHKGRGWEKFTSAIVAAVNKHSPHAVFLLWGKPAQAAAKGVKNPKHLILKAPHPSPLSAHRGFFGCKHFSQANKFLVSKGLTPIHWDLSTPPPATSAPSSSSSSSSSSPGVATGGGGEGKTEEE